MTVEISPEAALILNDPSNAYWKPGRDVIRVDAVAFDEPWFLAGPFNEKYGLVYISHCPQSKPLQQQLDEVEARVLEGCSTSYMPYSARQRFQSMYPNGVAFHWHTARKESFSEIDLPFLSEDILAGLERDKSRCQVFAHSEEGKAWVLAQLTPEEQASFLEEKKRAVKHIHDDMRRTATCKERPYLVRLQGTDDSSWSTTCEHLEAVEYVLEALRQRGQDAVDTCLVFTN